MARFFLVRKFFLLFAFLKGTCCGRTCGTTNCYKFDDKFGQSATRIPQVLPTNLGEFHEKYLPGPSSIVTKYKLS
mgnify:CR=1 FL=1